MPVLASDYYAPADTTPHACRARGCALSMSESPATGEMLVRHNGVSALFAPWLSLQSVDNPLERWLDEEHRQADQAVAEAQRAAEQQRTLDRYEARELIGG